MKKQPRTLKQLKQYAAKHKCTICGKEKTTVIQETLMDTVAECFLANHRNAFEELGK